MVAPSSYIKLIMIFYITDKWYIFIWYIFQARDVADYRDIMYVSELLEHPSYVEELNIRSAVFGIQHLNVCVIIHCVIMLRVTPLYYNLLRRANCLL